MRKNLSLKKFLILSLIFLFVFSIGSSFATDDSNLTGDTIASENNDVVELDDSNEIVYGEDNDVVELDDSNEFVYEEDEFLDEYDQALIEPTPIIETGPIREEVRNYWKTGYCEVHTVDLRDFTPLEWLEGIDPKDLVYTEPVIFSPNPDAIVNSVPVLNLSDVSAYYGSSDCVSFNLTSRDGLHFANETVNVCIFNDKYNKSFNCTSDSNGLVKFYLDKSLAVGNYLISVTYSDGKNNASGNSSLKVLKAPAKIVTSTYKTSYASGKKFNVKVINSKTNKSISGVKLSLKVYTGSSYKTLTGKTNAKGIASFDLSKYSVGNHKIIASASGNVSSAKKELKIKIVRANALAKLAKSSFKYKKADKLALTFSSKNTKKALSNLNVKVKIFTGKKSKTYNLKTDKNGRVKISTKGLSKGNHKIQISSSSKLYLLSKTTSIKVK